MSNGAAPADRWVFKREISIADLIAFATSMTFVIAAWGTLDKRLALLEAASLEQKTTDARQDRESLRLTQEVKEQLQRLNDKLDRVIEKR